MGKLENNQLYQAELMDHYKNPRSNKNLSNPDLSSGVFNPSCGDNISFAGIVKENKLFDLSFQGSGCVISQATSSMLSELIINQDINYLEKLNQQDILNLVKINLGPSRLRCALLSLEAVHHAIIIWQKKSI